MMKRCLAVLALALALGFYFHQKAELPAAVDAADSLASVSSSASAPIAKPLGAEPAAVVDAEEEAAVIPTFFPKAKVISKVADPVDSRGRQRVIETVETSMKEPYVRVERVFVKKANGLGRRQLGGEVAMVSNQLLLEKPDSLDKALFETMLRQAGAIDVSEIGEAFLATFAAEPRDPRALDTFMSRVKEVAGADVTVEPNYLRKMF